MLKEYIYIAGILVFLKWSNRGFKVDINTSLATFYTFFAFKVNDDNSVVYSIKDETLKVPKTALFNLQKGALTSQRPERTLLNGLIKLVFTPEELAISKVISKRDKGKKKALDQSKCSTIRGYFLYFWKLLHLMY